MARGTSDRSFGLMFAVVFGVLGVWPLFRHGGVRVIPVGVGVGFLALAMLWPAALHPLNRAWTAVGEVLGRIVNPLVAALLFFVVITPAGLISRWLRRDALRLKAAPNAESYWILRDPPGPSAESMSKQY